MISLLIRYLLTQPTVETAPLVLALQSSDLVIQLGGSGVEVKLVNTRDWEGAAPYAKLFDTGEITLLKDFVAGPSRIWIERLYMGIEVAAHGQDASVAGLRTDYLRLAVEGAIQPLTKSIPSNALTITDLGGSNSRDEIKRIAFAGGVTNKMVMGPGTSDTDPKYTAIHSSRVEVWVHHTRTVN